jgi:hypothetical protein
MRERTSPHRERLRVGVQAKRLGVPGPGGRNPRGRNNRQYPSPARRAGTRSRRPRDRPAAGAPPATDRHSCHAKIRGHGAWTGLVALQSTPSESSRCGFSPPVARPDGRQGASGLSALPPLARSERRSGANVVRKRPDIGRFRTRRPVAHQRVLRSCFRVNGGVRVAAPRRLEWTRSRSPSRARPTLSHSWGRSLCSQARGLTVKRAPIARPGVRGWNGR